MSSRRLTSWARVAASIAAAALVAAACTDDTPEASDSPGSGSPDAGSHPPDVPASPAGVETALDDQANTLTVSFAPVPNAEAYLLELDGDEEPIRLDADACDDECALTLDELTVAGAETATVSAMVGQRTSEPSEPVNLPAWPDEPEVLPEWPDDEPVALAITRGDETGRPVVETQAVPPDADVETRIAELEAEPDVIGVSIAPPLSGQDAELEFDIEDFPAGLTTWQQEAMNFPALPEEPRGEGVTVAIIDDGIYSNHPTINRADITSTNMLEPGRDAPGDHATAVTSMIVSDQPWLVPGIATGVDIAHYDVYNYGRDDDGQLDSEVDWSDPARYETFANAVTQAVDDGADIINISQAVTCVSVGSLDVMCPDDTLRPAFEYAEDQHVTVVAAAGNDGDGAEYCAGTNLQTWPAAFASVTAVGGTGRDGSRWPCTPDQDYVDLLAPAANLEVAASPDGYEVASGTSLATPLVAGLVASALAEDPDLGPADIRSALSYSQDHNDRLIPTAFLRALGIEPSGEPQIDLTTGREFIPFSVGLYFPEQSEVWRRAGLTHTPTDPTRYSDAMEYYDVGERYPWSPARISWSYNEPVTVLIGGLLVIDDDNNLTGYGGMQFDEYHVGHTIECPASELPRPRLTFRWDVPVLVSGTLEPADVGDTRRGDLRLSLGDGAEPDEAGVISGIRVLHDDLDDCAAIIDERDTIWQDPQYPWSEVQTWPDKVTPLLEEVYRQVIAESPFTLEEGFFPGVDEPREANSAHVSGGTLGDDVSFRLFVGEIDFRQLS